MALPRTPSQEGLSRDLRRSGPPNRQPKSQGLHSSNVGPGFYTNAPLPPSISHEIPHTHQTSIPQQQSITKSSTSNPTYYNLPSDDITSTRFTFNTTPTPSSVRPYQTASSSSSSSQIHSQPHHHKNTSNPSNISTTSHPSIHIDESMNQVRSYTPLASGEMFQPPFPKSSDSLSTRVFGAIGSGMTTSSPMQNQNWFGAAVPTIEDVSFPHLSQPSSQQSQLQFPVPVYPGMEYSTYQLGALSGAEGHLQYGSPSWDASSLPGDMSHLGLDPRSIPKPRSVSPMGGLPIGYDAGAGSYSDLGMGSMAGYPQYGADEYPEGSDVSDFNDGIPPYAELIYQALLSAPGHKMHLQDIYEWFRSYHSRFRDDPSKGWMNSIRHNLSMNGAFVKVERPANEPGKGFLWLLAPIAVSEGVKSTTRYRKSGPASNRAQAIDVNASYGDFVEPKRKRQGKSYQRTKARRTAKKNLDRMHQIDQQQHQDYSDVPAMTPDLSYLSESDYLHSRQVTPSYPSSVAGDWQSPPTSATRSRHASPYSEQGNSYLYSASEIPRPSSKMHSHMWDTTLP